MKTPEVKHPAKAWMEYAKMLEDRIAELEDRIKRSMALNEHEKMALLEKCKE